MGSKVVRNEGLG